ncbi:MAG: winged helix-turn-helix domain-containing protein [Methanocorpusculum sp.]|nr:winged helix-turn-helix domain-containing protein [Methanocorpusculum sp.]MDE2518660.1 winged helix-turn-helix domain-containing protein [Methanocorpusculum sp.]MDE2525064.1 winged helix-turn-helix domain-containing protein [Methanocorpusculum sp.]
MQRTEMPQSCITILRLLESTGSQTHKDIVAGTGLAPRTVRYALKRLKENGLVIEKFNFRDARQVIYQPKLAVPSNQASA